MIISATEIDTEPAILGSLIRFPGLRERPILKFVKSKYFSNPLYISIYEILVIKNNNRVEHIAPDVFSEKVCQHLFSDKRNSKFYSKYDKGKIYSRIESLYDSGASALMFSSYIKPFIKISLKKEITEASKILDNDKLLKEANKNFEEFDQYIKNIDPSKDGSIESFINVKNYDGLTKLEQIDKAMETPGELSNKNIVVTQFSDLDSIISGLFKKEITTIGARTGVGKTALSIDMCMNISTQTQQGVAVKVLFITLEMTEEQIFDRIICLTSKVKFDKINYGLINKEERNTISKEITKLKNNKNLFIKYLKDCDVDNVINTIRKYAEEKGISVVFIDYIQLVDDSSSMYDSENSKMKYICTKLKELAIELNIAEVFLAQLNRKIEDRACKIPKNSDIQQSGAIEQASCSILLLHRQGMEESISGGNNDSIDDIPESKTLKIFVRKNRYGRLGKVELGIKDYGKFYTIQDQERYLLS